MLLDYKIEVLIIVWMLYKTQDKGWISSFIKVENFIIYYIIY